MGNGDSGPPTVVDVKDGRITRIRPLHYETEYDKKDFNVWKIEARGKTLEPPLKARRSVRSASPTRSGSTRRTGCATRSSASTGTRAELRARPAPAAATPRTAARASTCASPGTRPPRSWPRSSSGSSKTYGPEAVLSQADMHGESKHLSASHGCANRLLSLLGGYTIQMRNLDSWEGWNWGAKHVWGCEPVGEMMPAANLYPDIAQNGELLLFWGCDPETTPHAIQGMFASNLCYWLSEIGLKSVYVCPDLNYGAAVHADKWIPILPNTDAALQLAIAYLWLTEGTYDKEYIATHSYGFDKFEDYVLGKEDGVPKTPAWASEKCGVPEWTIKALARDWANKVTSLIHGNGGPGIRGPFATEPARLEVMLLGMQGLGRPGVHQAKMIEWWFWREWIPLPYQGKIRPNIPNFVEQCRPVDCFDPARDDPAVLLGSQSEDARALTKLMDQPPLQVIPKCLVHDAILNPPISWWGLHSFHGPAEDQFNEHTYPAPGLLRDPHDLDRFSVLDHLLERLQQVHRSAPEPDDRDASSPSIPGWRTTA